MQIQLINTQLLDETSLKASLDSRLRMNHNFHSTLDDPLNRMINALEPDTYIRPHRHLNPPKPEAYILIRGEIDVLIFNEEGCLVRKETLCPDTGSYGIDIPEGVWHSILVKKPQTVIYEAKPGPFAPLAVEDFAPWSPEPDDEAGVREFFKRYKE